MKQPQHRWGDLDAKNRQTCARCGAVRWFEPGTVQGMRIVYVDAAGKERARVPECVRRGK